MKCDKCGKQLSEYYEKNGHNYCSECIKDFWPKCVVCGRPMNQWVEDKNGKNIVVINAGKSTCLDAAFAESMFSNGSQIKMAEFFAVMHVLSRHVLRCAACGKRMREWRYTQTGIRYCDETCRSKIENAITWYEKNNIADKPFKSYNLSQKDEYSKNKELELFAFLLLALHFSESSMQTFVNQICKANQLHIDFQTCMRQVFKIVQNDVNLGISQISACNDKYYYAHLLIIAMLCNRSNDFYLLSDLLQLIGLTKYEIRFLCNRILNIFEIKD